MSLHECTKQIFKLSTWPPVLTIPWKPDAQKGVYKVYACRKPYMQILATCFSEMGYRNLRSEILYKCVCKWVVCLKTVTSILLCFSLTLQTLQAFQPMCHSCFSQGEPSEHAVNKQISLRSSQFSSYVTSFNRQTHCFHLGSREGWGENLPCPPPCLPLSLIQSHWRVMIIIIQEVGKLL